ncbi:MAG TPA: AbrB/MazE/SpoVT family DNA-binding domain-containing protein [Thermoanaerobaculia bacterium]|nr:AbrB/MazE/SpoVT family DNA-binding domain-containing protein [Thermoanaerobaculia bacterium]
MGIRCNLEAVKTTIDRAGRLMIPRSIRDAAGIVPGSEVNLRLADGRIEIEPAPLEVRLLKRGPLTVAVARKRVAQLRPEVVGRTLARLRRRGSDESE